MRDKIREHGQLNPQSQHVLGKADLIPDHGGSSARAPDTALAPAALLADESFHRLLAETCSGSIHADWQVVRHVDHTQLWIHVRNIRTSPPSQGWKLHVSASVLSAEEVLRRSLPVLLAEDAAFKVVISHEVLTSFNAGIHGTSQIGKFITIYPNDDAQAVRLAVALDQATRGLRGPTIPSDRALSPGSLVHYRYGGFTGKMVQEPTGGFKFVIIAPDGTAVPDARLTTYRAPEWVVDPFVTAGIVKEPAKVERLIAGRYLIISPLHSSARSTVYTAVDIIVPRSCILKRGRRNDALKADGRDARDLVRQEAAFLMRLAPDPGFPTVFELIERENEIFLAMEEIPGATFGQHIAQEIRRFSPTYPTQVVAWGKELAALLAAVHAQGIIHRDVKASNVLVAPDGRLRLIDFDLAREPVVGGAESDIGTRGYMSPQQHTGDTAAITDDIYGLGALLYFAATGAEPHMAPHPFDLLRRPIRTLNPAIGPALEQVIARCLDPDPKRRFSTMTTLGAELAALGETAMAHTPPFGEIPVAYSEADARRRARALAYQLGNTLCAEAKPASGGGGLAWPSTSNLTGKILSRDINTGSSGAVLALAELVAEFGDRKHRAVLAEGAYWLLTGPRMEGAPLPGLYVGEAGVGAALLRAGQVLDDDTLISAAADHGRWVATLPYTSPDLYNGGAGRLRFHLFLWEETADPSQLQAAVEAGEHILTTAHPMGGDGLSWTLSPEFSGRTYLGYAHGAAGMADALLDLFEVTGDERYLTAACAAGRWLQHQTVRVLDDLNGLNWPDTEGGPMHMAFWCHGAAGIGTFFLHAAQLGVIPEAAELAAGAARTAARAARWAGPTQCHGLAGNIEFLLDMFQTTRDHAYLTEARSLAELLEAFATKQEGLLVWPGDSPLLFNPDYIIGYAGVAVCLLRLANPEHLPHQLSRAGFRHGRAERVVGS